MAEGLVLFTGILIFVAVAFLLAFSLVFIGSLTSYRREEPEKNVPYECGELPLTPARKAKFPVNYYSFAIGFLIFDIEVLFLLPWVAKATDYGFKTLIAVSIFLAVLLFGLFYGLKSGGFKWE